MFVSNIDLDSEMRIKLFEYLVLSENIDDYILKKIRRYF